MSHDERMLSGNWQPEDEGDQVACLNTLVSPKSKTRLLSISRLPSKGKRPWTMSCSMGHQV